MHDGYDKDVLGFNGVKQGVWKDPCQFAADILLDFCPCMWGFTDAYKSRIDALYETLA